MFRTYFAIVLVNVISLLTAIIRPRINGVVPVSRTAVPADVVATFQLAFLENTLAPRTCRVAADGLHLSPALPTNDVGNESEHVDFDDGQFVGAVIAAIAAQPVLGIVTSENGQRPVDRCVDKPLAWPPAAENAPNVLVVGVALCKAASYSCS